MTESHSVLTPAERVAYLGGRLTPSGILEAAEHLLRTQANAARLRAALDEERVAAE